MNTDTALENIPLAAAQSKTSPDDRELIVLIKRLQQQMGFLEKKIEILIGRSAQKPSFGREKRFSKPFRTGGPSHGHATTEGGKRSNERPFVGNGSFDKSRGGQSNGFRHPKKRPFHPKQKRD
ncbi:MAG: hypothetical protein Q8R76_07755 [Candidatus Omnitrophota bacterium]|nr:hypothetical protein [Candidatus Omnitrophota bacterium]